MSIERPLPHEYASFYADYVARVTADDVLALLETQSAELPALLAGLSEAQAEHRPTPAEWSIKEVLGHLADGERIFAYRALRIARGDRTPLPGFDQDAFIAPGEFNARPLASLLDELKQLRASTLAFVRGLPGASLARIGTASDSPISARALVYIIAGHEHHHLESLRTVYLVK